MCLDTDGVSLKDVVTDNIKFQPEHAVEKPRNEDFLTNINGIKGVCMAVLVAPTRVSMTNLLKRFVRILRCYVDRGPADAAEAKVFVCQALFKFRNFHSMLLPESQGVYEYYEKMSDMVAILIDLEILSNSETSNASLTNRVLTFLHLFFDDQAEYVLHTLLKLRCMTNDHSEIINLILLKVLDEISRRPICVDIYVPFFLVSRVWLDIIKENKFKTFIISNARLVLGEKLPTDVLTFFKDVFPPGEQTTEVLIQHEFDVKKSCQQFLDKWRIIEENNFETEPHEEEEIKNEENSAPVNDEKVINTEDNIKNKINNSNTKNNNLCLNDKISNDKVIDVNSKCSKFDKSNLCKSKVPNNGEILVIDLTSDNLQEQTVKKISSPIWTFSSDIPLQDKLTDTFKLIETKYRPTNSEDSHQTTTSEDKSVILAHKAEDSHPVIEIEDAVAVQINVTPPKIEDHQPRNEIEVVSPNVVTEDITLKVKVETVSTVEVEPTTTPLIKEDILTPLEDKTTTLPEDKSTTVEDKSIFAAPANVSPLSTNEDKTTITTFKSPLKSTVIQISVPKGKTEDNKSSMKIWNTSQSTMETQSTPATRVERNSCRSHQKIAAKSSAEPAENLDGLLLLASVSQTASRINIENVNNIIKVKDYADLTEKGVPMQEMKHEVLLETVPLMENGMENACPNALYEVERLNEVGTDAPNAILNGETVVLRPKFPHSNLYIINKAVDTKTDGDEEMNDHVSREDYSQEKNTCSYSNTSKVCLSCQHICKSCGMSPPKTANASRFVACSSCTYEVATYCRQCYCLPRQGNNLLRMNGNVNMMENGYEIKTLEAALRFLPLHDKALLEKVAYEMIAFDTAKFNKFEEATYERVTYERVSDGPTKRECPADDISNDSVKEDIISHESASKLPFKKRLRFDSKIKNKVPEAELQDNEAELALKRINESSVQKNLYSNVQVNGQPFVHISNQPVVHYSHQPWVQHKIEPSIQNKIPSVPNSQSVVHLNTRSWVPHNVEPMILNNIQSVSNSLPVVQVNHKTWVPRNLEPPATNIVPSVAPIEKPKKTSSKKKSTSRGKKTAKTSVNEVRTSARISKRNLPKIDYAYSESSEEDYLSSNMTKRRRKSTR